MPVSVLLPVFVPVLLLLNWFVPELVIVPVPFELLVLVPLELELVVPFELALFVPLELELLVPLELVLLVPFELELVVPFVVLTLVPLVLLVFVPLVFESVKDELLVLVEVLLKPLVLLDAFCELIWLFDAELELVKSNTLKVFLTLVMGLDSVMPCNAKIALARPPTILPAPWSLIDVICRNTVLPRKSVRSISFIAPRMVVDTRRCSMAKRLPPP